MRKLVAHSVSESCSDTETIGEWLRRYRQSDRVIEQFWSVILVSVTGETVDRIALSVAQMIFREGFFASRTASDLFMPRMPLSEIFHDRLGRWLRERGVAIHCQTPVRRIEGDSDRVSSVVLADGSRHAFDFVGGGDAVAQDPIVAGRKHPRGGSGPQKRRSHRTRGDYRRPFLVRPPCDFAPARRAGGPTGPNGSFRTTVRQARFQPASIVKCLSAARTASSRAATMHGSKTFARNWRRCGRKHLPRRSCCMHA